MFKYAWEKTSSSYHLPYDLPNKMIKLAYPNKRIDKFELITGGCANLNIKIQLENETQPLILRVYLRDKNAAYCEQKLAVLLKETLPVPLTYYIGELEEYNFAITEFMTGISLRELLLSGTPYDLSAMMYDVGLNLSKISEHKFLKAGFMNKDLELVQYEYSDVIKFVSGLLNDENVLSVLSPEVILGIQKTIEKNVPLLTAYDETKLVHGDFDPANILVDRINGSWVVTGILDWEFAFVGTSLWDVANMLRYSHEMPVEFSESFIKGVRDGGVILQDNWQDVTDLLNLISLVDLLSRTHLLNNPIRLKDITNLINYFLSCLKK